MTTTKPSSARAAMVVVAALLLLLLLAAAATATTGTEAAAARATASTACNPALLTPCAGPALFGGAVPPECCEQLRAQPQRCLCGYARSPNYGSYIRSPNAAKLFAACKVAMPRCG